MQVKTFFLKDCLRLSEEIERIYLRKGSHNQVLVLKISSVCLKAFID